MMYPLQYFLLILVHCTHNPPPHTHPQRGVVTPTTQGTLFQTYLNSLVLQLSPNETSPGHMTNSLKGSLGKLSISSTYSASSIRDYYSLTPPPPSAPQVMRKSKTTHLDHPLGESTSTASSQSSLQSTTRPLPRSQSPDDGVPPPTQQPLLSVTRSESPERKREDESPGELSMDELDTSDMEETEL